MKKYQSVLTFVLVIVLMFVMPGCYLDNDGRGSNDSMAWSFMIVGFLVMLGSEGSGLALLGGAILVLIG